MKKSVCMLFSAIIALSLTVAGCGSAPAAAVSPAAKKVYPSFVTNPPSAEGVIYGTGSSTSKDPSIALRQAKERAKVDIANKLSSQVKAMVTDYTRQAGTGDDVTDLKFYESISQSLTNATLIGLEDAGMDMTDDGTTWALVRMSKADAAKAAVNAFESEASQYAEFKALNALDAMNAQLEKADPKELQPSAAP